MSLLNNNREVSGQELAFLRIARLCDFPLDGWEREYAFHPSRNWRFDFALPELLVAVEIEGGTSGKSRHTSRAGFQNDRDKYNAAQSQGWAVLSFTSRDLSRRPQQVIELVQLAVDKRRAALDE